MRTVIRAKEAFIALVGVFALSVAAVAQNQPQTVPVEAEGTSVQSDYRIGPGDVLRVFVLGSPELAAEVPVRPDGKISTPLAADVVAVGKTPAELSKDLESALTKYVRNPTVSVIVASALSTFSQIRVVGQAATPKAIPYRSGMTVLDAIIQVGGLSQFAAGNRAKIIRRSSGKSKEIRVRLSDLINKGDVTQDMPLEAGDVLVVPEARF